MKKPNIIVHLDVKPEESLRRIRSRQRDCEKDIPIEYLRALYDAYEKFIAEISRVIPVIKVNWSTFRTPEVCLVLARAQLCSDRTTRKWLSASRRNTSALLTSATSISMLLPAQRRPLPSVVPTPQPKQPPRRRATTRHRAQPPPTLLTPTQRHHRARRMQSGQICARKCMLLLSALLAMQAFR